MTESKLCPILAAGRGDYYIRPSNEYGGTNLYLRMQDERGCECLRDACEWFGHGCPAHPRIIQSNKAPEDWCPSEKGR